jgi:uncharacterized protein with HEPN domain
MSRDLNLYLDDILASISNIQSDTQGMTYEMFIAISRFMSNSSKSE